MITLDSAGDSRPCSPRVRYERLFVWVQQNCQDCLAESGEEKMLRRALELLRERPVYFQHCAREIAQVPRSRGLVQRGFAQEPLGALPRDVQGTSGSDTSGCD